MTFLKTNKFKSKHTKIVAVVLAALTTLTACNNESASTLATKDVSAKNQQTSPQLIPEFKNRLDIYKEVTLSADLSHLSANQKKC
tara:strand:- start:68737 stop:68991 length:255 start_codon:yes stop_codon:yes gene_type:complete